MAERDGQLSASITLILDVLEVPEPREDVVATLVALVEGLTLSACLGRLTPEHATELAIAHVIELGSAAGDLARRGRVTQPATGQQTSVEWASRSSSSPRGK